MTVEEQEEGVEEGHLGTDPLVVVAAEEVVDSKEVAEIQEGEAVSAGTKVRIGLLVNLYP